MANKLHSWFVPANVNSHAKLRLFCFPYAGGGASVYRDWHKFFPKEIEVCAVQLPGRESRGLEAPIHSLDQLVLAITEEIQPLLNMPFALFGHSMGALLAFETARQLIRKNKRTPDHLFVSGRSAPHLIHRNTKLHLLPDNELKNELRLLNGTPDAVLQNNELMDLLMPRLRADFEVCETYSYAVDEPIHCPITAYGGMDDHGVSFESLAAWKEHTSNDVDLKMFEGDHFFLHSEQEHLTQSLSSSIFQTAKSLQRSFITVPAR
ncbi:thioesterase II family protein [Paenibacillus harenae]|uniref:thioesterase II family protein n=1 Tax=Paenibacillus harenae TaxID=306543 RepID=UPI0004278ADF|nr:thioesterase II family protein [Paenibacillus harenae]